MRIEDTALWGRGSWVGTVYVLKSCPICKDTATFRFMDGGNWWACPSCDGMGTYEQLFDVLSKRDDWIDRLNRLDEIDAPQGLVSLSTYKRNDDILRIGTGFSFLDNMIGGLAEGALTVLTGKRGEGKSTLASQIALNAITLGKHVCFYSGELNAAMFQTWVFQQAAGPMAVVAHKDQFGVDRWRADEKYEPYIREWLKGKFFLSDNETTKSSEHSTILERFTKAIQMYGVRLLFVDNLMTTHFGDSENFYRLQSAFVGRLVEFAQEHRAHIVLVAHPRKGEGGDDNDQVSGTGDITNKASVVMKVSRDGDANTISVTKNREYGQLGNVKFTYNVPSRRFLQSGGTMITRYAWENLLSTKG